MDYKRNKKIFLETLKCQTSEELEKIVKEEKLDQERWLPYGGRENNVGTIDGQMRDADNALMEKITNSIDAILMRRCYEEGIDPREKNVAPKTMTEAVQKFFGDRESLRKKRSEFAKEWLRVTAEGKKNRPTITIIDKGEGQQPNNIKETILSLNKDIKEKISFVYGTYNQGGSSSLGFAGKSDSYDFNYLQLVLCRRPPTIKDKEKTNNHDHFGFTIVRKRFDYVSEKFTYEYLVEKGTNDIFSFPPDEPVEINDYKFEEGCIVRLYDYQLTPPGNIVLRGLNEFIDKKLPISPLPIYLKELRDVYGGGKDYSVFGLKEKLLRKKESLRETYPQKLPVDLGEIGKREVELFILKHKTESKEEPSDMLERVFFIKDGLVLHTENMSWLRNECDLVDLAPYIFAFIDISTISPPIAQMLHSGREKFKNNATTRLALDRLKIFFASETLKELDKEYGKFGFSSESAFKDEVLRKELMKEVENQPELRDFFDLGEDFPIKDEGGEEPPQDPDYEGTYLPKKFDLVGTSPREVEDGSYCKISFDTSAATRLFERREDRGEYDWEKSENFQIAFSSFKNGRLTFRIDPNQDIKPPQKEVLVFYLRVPSKNINLKGIVTILLKEKIPYEGKEFPTFFTPPKKVKIAIDSAKHLHIKTDAVNDYLDREKNPGTVIFKEHDDIEFGKPRLKDGTLALKIRCKAEKVKEAEDIQAIITDNRNEFELVIPVKIIPQETEPQVDLPKPELVEREKWENDTPEWDEDVIARIPSWKELKRIKINIDSRPFDNLKKIPAHNREAARAILIKQIYINSIWMFLEFKDLKLSDNEENGVDMKEKVFEKAIRATSKMIIQNIKKLLR